MPLNKETKPNLYENDFLDIVLEFIKNLLSAIC